jgi:hypothetical protein
VRHLGVERGAEEGDQLAQRIAIRPDQLDIKRVRARERGRVRQRLARVELQARERLACLVDLVRGETAGRLLDDQRLVVSRQVPKAPGRSRAGQFTEAALSAERALVLLIRR